MKNPREWEIGQIWETLYSSYVVVDIINDVALLGDIEHGTDRLYRQRNIPSVWIIRHIPPPPTRSDTLDRKLDPEL